MNGRVTETPPTSNTGIGGATVTITSGADAGRSARTDSMGFFSLHDVAIGAALHVSAAGYLDASHPGGSQMRSNFQLMPEPRTSTTTMADSLSADVGKCSDGVALRPCHIMTIPIHNSGAIEASLSWEPVNGADLDLSLFRGSSTRPVARAATASSPEEIRIHVEGGSNYELRVTYAQGTAPAKYVLRVTHQN